MTTSLQIPLATAELLHATLGPLANALAREGHPWADTAQRVLSRYADDVAEYVTDQYGPGAPAEVYLTTMQAAQRVEMLACGDADNTL